MLILKAVSKTTKELFHFKRCSINPGYGAGLKTISLRSCLIGNNGTQHALVKTQPKWLTKLGYYNVSEDGEIIGSGEYDTDDFKKANSRKISALDAFCKRYDALYRKRHVSLLFHTFTQANKARMPFNTMIKLTRKRYRKLGYEIKGFIWTAEVSERMHWHYHLCVAVDRMTVKKIPVELKLNDLWGRRTGIEFVRKDVKHYMAKYFAKQNYRVIGTRSYGRSRHFLN